MTQTLRERLIGLLSVSESEFTGAARNNEAEGDAEAAKIIRAARLHVVKLRDWYASEDQSKEVEPTAAQDIYELGQMIEKIGKDSKNANAMRDLKFESDRLHQILAAAADEIGIDAQNRRVFMAPKRK
jgi:signal transduction histidine kinase